MAGEDGAMGWLSPAVHEMRVADLLRSHRAVSYFGSIRFSHASGDGDAGHLT
ncbi:MAG: hypothetical protein WD423_05625 [Rhodothermales bacterium]